MKRFCKEQHAAGCMCAGEQRLLPIRELVSKPNSFEHTCACMYDFCWLCVCGCVRVSLLRPIAIAAGLLCVIKASCRRVVCSLSLPVALQSTTRETWPVYPALSLNLQQFSCCFVFAAVLFLTSALSSSFSLFICAILELRVKVPKLLTTVYLYLLVLRMTEPE